MFQANDMAALEDEGENQNDGLVENDFPEEETTDCHSFFHRNRFNISLIVSVLILFILMIIFLGSLRNSSYAMLYTRIFQTVTTFLMIASIILMLWDVCKVKDRQEQNEREEEGAEEEQGEGEGEGEGEREREGDEDEEENQQQQQQEELEQERQQHQNSPKFVGVFVLFLAAVAFFGYLLLLRNYAALWENNEALDYRFDIELIMDVVFIIAFLIFLVTILLLIYRYASHIEFRGLTVRILKYTLVFCYFQKWLFKCIEGYDHYCHKQHQKNRRCDKPKINYKNTLDDLTTRQKYLYEMMAHDTKFIYTCTMELFPALLALLHHMTSTRKQVAENELTGNHDHQHRIRNYNSARRVSLREAWTTGILLVLSSTALFADFFGHPLLFPLYDNPTKNEWAVFINAIGRFMIHLLNSLLYVLILWVWRANAEQNMTLIQMLRRLLSRSYVTLPDMAILMFATISTILTSGFKCIIHLSYYASGNDHSALWTAGIVLADISNFLMVLSFCLQMKVLKNFLMFSHDSYKELRDQKIIRWMPLFGIISNLLHFASVYSYKSSTYTTDPSVLEAFDVLAAFESGPATSDLFSVTAAVCWIQIAEYLYEAGAYKFKVD